MKVGIFTSVVYPWMIDLGIELRKKGFTVYLYSLGTFGNYPWESLNKSTYAIGKIQTRPVPSPSLFVDIRRLKCDAMIFLSVETLLGLLVFFVSGFSSKKRIVIAEENKPLNSIVWRVKKAIVKLMYREANSVVAESERSKSYVLTTLGVSDKSVLVAPHGVVVSKFSQNNPGSSERVVFLFVGEISHYKGADYLLDAIDLISNDASFRQRILVKLRPKGPLLSSSIFQRRMRRLIDIGIIKTYSDVPLDEMSHLYDSSDVVLVPSSDMDDASSDRSPNSLLEGLAAGKAIIATSVGGIPSIAQNAAYYIDAKDPASLAEAIKCFASKESFRNEYAKLSRERAKELDMKLYADTIAQLM